MTEDVVSSVSNQEIIRDVGRSVDSVEAERGPVKFLMAVVKGALPAFASARFARIGEQPKLAALQAVSATAELGWLVGGLVGGEPVMFEGYLLQRFASLRLEGLAVLKERKEKEERVIGRLGS